MAGTSTRSQYVQAGSLGGADGAASVAFGIAGTAGSPPHAHSTPPTARGSTTAVIARLTIGANASLEVQVAIVAVSSTNKEPFRFDARRPHGGGPPRVPLATVVSLLLLATLAAIGAAWGVARHYTAKLPPMHVPAQPADAPSYDADAGEVPAPDLERTP